MYMDDIKLVAKNEKELKILIQKMKIYSDDIGIEFGIEKCAMLKMRSGKRQMTEGKKLRNQGKIRTLGDIEIYKYLGILEAATIKQAEIKEKKNQKWIPQANEKTTLNQTT